MGSKIELIGEGNMSFEGVEKIIEKCTGLSIEQIRKMGMNELRRYIEEKSGKKITFGSAFPFIGRSNVLRDNLVTTEEINMAVDAILEKEGLRAGQ